MPTYRTVVDGMMACRSGQLHRPMLLTSSSTPEELRLIGV